MTTRIKVVKLQGQMDESKDVFLEVHDYEIFGVGAERKEHWIQLHQTSPLRLLRHNWSFLPGIPEETLAWLKPEKTETRSFQMTPQLFSTRFHQIFPVGQSLLGDLQAKILSDYSMEMPWVEGLIDDHFRYFAFFLKGHFPQHQDWQEIFVCEWTRWSRRYQDLPWAATENPSRYELNPSLQFYRLGPEAAAVLGVGAGMHACFYDDRKRKMQEHLVQRDQARALDLLEEDMGFSREKILALLTEELGAEQAAAVLRELRDLRILR